MTQIGVCKSDSGEKGPQCHGEPEVVGDQGGPQAGANLVQRVSGPDRRDKYRVREMHVLAGGQQGVP